MLNYQRVSTVIRQDLGIVSSPCLTWGAGSKWLNDPPKCDAKDLESDQNLQSIPAFYCSMCVYIYIPYIYIPYIYIPCMYIYIYTINIPVISHSYPINIPLNPQCLNLQIRHKPIRVRRWSPRHFAAWRAGRQLITGGRLPSGKHTKNYGKSPFFMGKSTINGHVQ